MSDRSMDMDIDMPLSGSMELFKTEPPELAQWDYVRSNPVSKDILDRIPIEIWRMILNRVPPTRLARLLRVSKRWSTLIPELPVWRRIIDGCALATTTETAVTTPTTATTDVMTDTSVASPVIERPIANPMKHVLDHMVLICDVCHERSHQFGSNLPLPVRRPDLLGLTWMCKRCRDWYGAIHPEVMNDPTRAFKDSDVYEQGPSVRPRRRGKPQQSDTRLDRGWGSGRGWYDDFFDDDLGQGPDQDYGSDDDGGEYDSTPRPLWQSQANPDSWLNQVLRQGRIRLLKAMLGMYGLEPRGDFRPCTDFIDGTQYEPRKIVVAMREMHWLSVRTGYREYNFTCGPERARALAITVWVQGLEKEHPGSSMEMLKVVPDAPPESLWPQVEYVLRQFDMYYDRRQREKEEREQRRQQQEIRWQEREARRRLRAEQGNADEDMDDEEEEEEDWSDGEVDSDVESDKSVQCVSSDLSSKFSFKVDCAVKNDE
ncbi:hypothetical protein BGX34_000669 [Mortierella sp. NVP85]|nr:hypothetical protein BGX34_000669 [Mortierella sp. NVP85]